MIRNVFFSTTLTLFICLGIALLEPVRSAYGGERSFFAAEKDNGSELSFLSVPLQTMTSIPFVLDIRDSSGGRIVDARVACELTMPAMPMPENRPRVAPTGTHYRGEAVFTMAGAWRMTCRIAPPTGSTFSLSFDIPGVRLK